MTGSTARHPIDWLVGTYLALTLILLLVRPHLGDAGPLIVFRIAILAAIAIAWMSRAPRHPVARFLRVAYPALLYGAFYAELDVLNTCITTSRFDTAIVAWEKTVFRSMPSIELREWLPWWPVAELVHVGYLAYYLMVPALLLLLAVRRNLAAVSESVFAITATFVVCYAFFIALPVVGPFHHLVPPEPADVGRVLPFVTHRILHAGSSVGTAFPSSHVAVAVAVTMAALRYARGWGWILVGLTTLLALGAVYGGYHYAIDATAGALVALLTVPAARSGWRRLGSYPGDDAAG